jgi:hypothetical protein
MRCPFIVKPSLRSIFALSLILLHVSSALKALEPELYNYQGLLPIADWTNPVNWNNSSGSSAPPYPNGQNAQASFGDSLLFPLATTTITNTDGVVVSKIKFNSNALIGTYGYKIGTNVSLLNSLPLLPPLQSPETLTFDNSIGDNSIILNRSLDKQLFAGNIRAMNKELVVTNFTPLGSAREIIFQADSGVADFFIDKTLTFGGTNNVIVNDPLSSLLSGTRLVGPGGLLINFLDNQDASLILGKAPGAPNTYAGDTIIGNGGVRLYAADTDLLGTSTNPIYLGAPSGSNSKVTLDYAVNATNTRSIAVASNFPENATIKTSALTGVTTVDNNTIALNGQVQLGASPLATLRFGQNSIFTGTGNVRIVGPGTIEIRGTSTPVGDTIVDGGRLLLNNPTGASIVGAGNSLIINSGTTATIGQNNQLAPGVKVALNGGILDLNNNNPSMGTLGPLTLSGSSQIEFGIGLNSTTVKFSSLVPGSGNVVLNNWVSDPLITGQQDHIFFESYNDIDPARFKFGIAGLGLVDAQLIINGGWGELVPVPEPATVVSGMFGFVSLIATTYINRKRRPIDA